ncbi:hypothetical protein COU76_02690 [Candidatus Peregrinibacteria bacterium CG10_big_fil_rev_8_21_14_0_10_49_10]|nr:MAG: hypothetical protein COU76_02690 [Candidatus Peregrinibacteria bacterium CG10_big_fil_rev_8_21_14_0_10_49_10]
MRFDMSEQSDASLAVRNVSLPADVSAIIAEQLPKIRLAIGPTLEGIKQRLRLKQHKHIFVVDGGDICEASVRDEGRIPSVVISRLKSGGYVSGLTPGTQWAMTREELERKLAIDSPIEDSISALTNNDAGGVDPGSPLKSSLHLLVRISDAFTLDVDSMDDLVQEGLFDQTLYVAFKNELDELFKKVTAQLTALKSIDQNSPAYTAVANALLPAAIEIVFNFVQRNARKIELLSQTASDPEATVRVLEALLKTQEQCKEILAKSNAPLDDLIYELQAAQRKRR